MKWGANGAMPRGGGARGSIQAFKTLSHFPGGRVGSIQGKEWAERRDYVERKRIITLLDFQCQRSIFHEGSSCGIMQGGIFRLYVLVSGHSPAGHS